MLPSDRAKEVCRKLNLPTDGTAWLYINEAIEQAIMGAGLEPIPMVLYCYSCKTRHVDGEEHCYPKDSFAHYCEVCGVVWRPANCQTKGVERLY